MCARRKVPVNWQSIYYYHRGKLKKKILTNHVNTFRLKKLRLRTWTISLWENSYTLLFGKKLNKQIASRCESSKNIEANKLYKKLVRVIPTIVFRKCNSVSYTLMATFIIQNHASYQKQQQQNHRKYPS